MLPRTVSPPPGSAGGWARLTQGVRALRLPLAIAALSLLLDTPTAATPVAPASRVSVAPVPLLLLRTTAVATPACPLAGIWVATATPNAAASGEAAPGTASDSTAVPLAPRQALMRSAVLPGWGQLSNGHPFRGLLFAGTAAGFLTAGVLEARAVNDANDDAERERRTARRNTRYLLFVTTVTLAAVDAYVDAHLADFGPEPQLDIDRGLVALTCTWRF